MIFRAVRPFRLPFLALLTAQIVIVAGPASAGAAVPRQDSLGVGAWREDLRYLATELPLRHANAFHTISRAEFERHVRDLDARLPTMPPERIPIELARLGARIGDGHTGVMLTSNRLRGTNPNRGYRRMPLEFAAEESAVFVLAATPEMRRLIGREILRVEGVPIQTVLDSLRAIVSTDNRFGIDRNALRYLAVPEVLYGLGVAPTPDSIRFTFRAEGGVETVVVRGVEFRRNMGFVAHMPTERSRLAYERRDERFWARAVPEDGIIYAQVNSWDIGAGEGDRLFTAFADSLERLLAAPGRPKLVLDFRWNAGGRIEAARPLLGAILRTRHLAEEGRLFAITSNTTFSAAVLFLLDLERYTNVVIVGEPVAGRPNAYGFLDRFRLPNSGIEVRYSAAQMTRGDPWDPRPSIFPDVDAPLTLSDYRAGIDAPLEAIVAYRERSPVGPRIWTEIRRSGVDAALATYRRLRADSTARYAFGEIELDAVADSLIAAGRVADAVRVLELNVREYPWQGWLHFNLAEAQRRAGDTTAALANYRRAFDMDRRLAIARDRVLDITQGRVDP